MDLKTLLENVNKKLGDMDTITAAVRQLEEESGQLNRWVRDEMKKIRLSVGPRNNYKGVFDSEDEARAFGLYALAKAGPVALQEKFKELLKSESRDLAEAVDSTGGALVPNEFSSRIIRLVDRYGAFSRNVFTMPMSEAQLNFARSVDGVHFYKVGEGTAATQANPTWAPVTLNAAEWAAYVVYSRSLFEDVATISALGEIIAQEFAQGLANDIDDSGFIGDGTPDYRNIIGITTKLVSINGVDDGGGLVKATGAAAAKWTGIVQADITKLISRARYDSGNHAFYGSHEFYWTVIAPIILAAGGATMAEFERGPQLQVFGKRYEVTPSMPRISGDSQVCLLYGDLMKSSTLGSRKSLTLEDSSHVKFLERQTAMLGTVRIDINNHSLGDATTAGPMVGLITPAAE